MKLDRSFFERDAVTFAKALLGCRMVHVVEGEVRMGIITEVEAYLAVGDAAAHAARNIKAAIRALGQGAGTLYIHPMRQYVGMDIVAKGGSVLVRAMQNMQGLQGALDGPGKVCRAMGITRAHNGVNLITSPTLWLEQGNSLPYQTTARIGIARSTDLPLRFKAILD